MGKIILARVDDRLVHGKVMTKWTKGNRINAIYIVDNDIATDSFMKDIYVNANSTGGISIKVYSTKDVVNKWHNDKFVNDIVVLIFKNVSQAWETINFGLPLHELCVGGVAKKPNSKKFIPDVSLTEEDQKIVQSISDLGIDVYFQSVPETKRVEYKN